MENQIEIWKDIPGYEGYYQVSNLSNVKSLSFNRTGKEKLLKQCINSRNYLGVKLWKNKKPISFNIHQIVAMAFLEHKLCGYEVVVDHIDNNKLNNNLSNIQLISPRENASKDKKGGTSNYIGVSFNNKTKKWVSQIREKGIKVYLGSFFSEKDASESYNNALIKIQNSKKIQKKIKKTTSKYKYVHYSIKNKKWKAVYKTKYLGLFKTEKEAYNATLEYYKTITLNKTQ